MSRLRRHFASHAALLFAVVMVGIAATLLSSAFASRSNITQIFLSASTYFIMACPAALLIIGGGLDFAVGATFTAGAVSATYLMVNGVPWVLALLLGVGAGAVIGVVSGTVVVNAQVPPIIATLGVFYVLTGFVEVYFPADIAPLPQGFLNLASGTVATVPLLVWYAASVGVVFWFLLEKTPLGYAARAVGGNRSAAIAVGLRVKALDIFLYVLAGSGAALAGILFASQTSAGQPDAGGADVTLQVITAVLIGGISLRGGIGSIGGVALGTLLISELQNGLAVTSFNPLWADVVVGTILVLAVALDGARRRRQFRYGVAELPDDDLEKASSSAGAAQTVIGEIRPRRTESINMTPTGLRVKED